MWNRCVDHSMSKLRGHGCARHLGEQILGEINVELRDALESYG